MTNKTLDLMRKYSVDIAAMCNGTKLEGRETKCIRFKLANGDYSYISSSPEFVYQVEAGTTLEFAVAVLEDNPVFELDEFYFKNSGNTERCYVKDGHLYVNEGLYKHIDEVNFKLFTWNKPTPKRTFQLNGVEFTCPVKNFCSSKVVIKIFNVGEYSDSYEYNFESVYHQKSVANALIKILSEARDK